MARKPQDLLADVERREKALRKHWLDAADEAVDIYEAEEDEKVPFNILYSNTETILPALYNQTPRPEVARRYPGIGEQTVLDKTVAQVSERVLEYSADTNSGEYQTYDAAVRFAVLKALVPGAGIVRVRYKEENKYQELCYESVAYDRFVWGYARAWVNVPWVAFGHDLNKADFEATFPDFVKTKEYREFKWDEAADDDDAEAARRDESGTKKEPTVLVWEVWTAASRKVQFVSTTFRDKFIKDDDYPFALTMRFPMPEPLKFVLRNDNLTPVPPYALYQKQAEELNEVTRRLHLVLKAIKVRGGYNAQLTEIGQILDSDETTLVPVENASNLAESGGLEKHIWLMPLQDLVNVAKTLYEAQQSAKQSIYEIMGIGDILRGQSVASETAAAQKLKDQWGSLRIKRWQKDVASFCRDLFRVTLEFAANLYTPATFAQITKLPLATQGQKAMLQQSMAQQMQQPQQGQPGQPPQPPQPPPEVMQTLSLPAWEEVVAILRDRFERSYRIDIETNSTVDLEATEDKTQMAEFMNAFGQMTAGLTPLMDSGAMPFEAGKLIMSEVFRRYRFARRIEQALDAIKPPPPKEDPKVAKEKSDAEMAKVQAESKRQIGEMQETVIEKTAEIERLNIEVTALKAQNQTVAAEASLKEKGAQVEAKTQKNALQMDYANKAAMQKEQVTKMQDQLVVQQLQAAIQQGQQQMQAQIDQLRQEVQQALAMFGEKMNASQQVSAAKQEVAAARTEQKAVQSGGQLESALTALIQNQGAVMDALKQVASLAGAEREAELYVGPDGKKRSRSRVIQ